MPEEDLFLELKIVEHTMEPQTETALQEQDIVNENEMQDDLYWIWTGNQSSCQ